MASIFELPECHGIETAKHWEIHMDIFETLGKRKFDGDIVESPATVDTAGYQSLLNEILKEQPNETLFPNPDRCKNCDVNISCAVTALNILCRSFKMKND